MNTGGFFFSLLDNFPVIPAAILCFLPMKNQLRYGVSKTVRNTALLFLPLFLVMAYIESSYETSYNTLTPFVLIVCFTYYRLNVKVHFSKALAIFVLVCAIFGFLANFANAFDAAIHPTLGINDFSMEAAAFQAVITLLFVILVFLPASKYGSLIIDGFHIYRVWYTSTIVSLFFLVYNLITVPYHYETLHVNNVFLFFCISLPMLFTLLLLLCVLFYFIVSGMIEAGKTENEKNILEMEKSQFHKQRKYLEATAKERHDFKHAVRTIKSLSSEGKYEELDKYIEQYIEKMPELTVKTYCSIPAVNAVLNYYKETARMDGIPLSLDVSFPEDKELPETELCSILGNILENAINACRVIEPYKRFIRLTVTVMNGYYLCIAAVNSFNGEPLIRNGRYFSTGHSGSGIGLESITSIAASMGGSADFSHEDQEFFSNVMLPL